ncbi:MAG: FAD-binding protein [Opitutae bacterium]|nr:FAD-binding protein [Opitutae bacterium]
MSTLLSPTSCQELAEAVRASPSLLPVGAGTKPALSAPPPGTAALSLRGLTGMLEYEPDEFTFTARAGSTVQEIAAALAAHGQYLPFDPPFAAAGATLGGTVASGLSGPGRFRFGGVLDFILGVRFVDGEGRLLRMGGKVVKNAAGFDLPKFFTGSAGRFGVMAEITMKVFPRHVSTRTLRLRCPGLTALVRTLTDVAATAWEPDALEASPADTGVTFRFAGPADAVASLAGAALKVPVTPTRICALLDALAPMHEARVRLGNGGDVAWLSFAEPAVPLALDETLRRLGLPAVTLRGGGPRWPGAPARPAIAAAVKRALDPHGRFPSCHD